MKLVFSKNNRSDWTKERKINQETFGHSAGHPLNYPRGFRGHDFSSGNRFQSPQFGYNRGGGRGGNNNNVGRPRFTPNRGGMFNNYDFNVRRQYNRDTGRGRYRSSNH